MKIIGNTVGMGLPKPNLMQTDHTKGDYVKGKEEFLKQINGGVTAEEAAQIAQNKQDIETLNRDKLDASKVPEVVNEALAQAKASGEFDGTDGKDGKDGQDGYTPQKGVDYFDGQNGKDGVDGKDGYTPQKGIDYFDGKDGKDGQDGQNGSDYVLTEADKQEIAEQAAQLVDVPSGGGSNQPLTFTGAVNATYDGSEAVSVEIPAGGGGGGSEWKLLTHTEIAEDGVSSIVFTETENGEPLSYVDLAIIAKAAIRENVSSFKVFSHGTNQSAGYTLLQTNTFGNASKIRYYGFTYLKMGDIVKADFIESNYNVFTNNGIAALATNTYAPGTQFYKKSDAPHSTVRLFAVSGFVSGDIIEVWYR